MHLVAANPHQIDFPEPAFRHFSSKRLLPEPADKQALSHLCARVAATPGDLLSHTQRILLSYRQGDTDHAFGALVDLFVATGTKALPLRKTLLARCQDLISFEQRTLLSMNLVVGLTETTAPACSHSVLGKGIISQSCAVSRTP